MLSYETFLKGIKLLEIVITHKFTTDEKEVYYKLLQDIDNKTFLKGLENLIKERVFTNKPTIAEIRKFCLDRKQEAIDLKIYDNIEKLNFAIDKGYFYNIVFDDPVMHLVISKYGGFNKITQLSNDEYNNFIKYDFPKMYKIYFKNIQDYILEIPKFAKVYKKEAYTLYIFNQEQAENWQKNLLTQKKILGIELNKEMYERKYNL